MTAEVNLIVLCMHVRRGDFLGDTFESFSKV